MPELKHTFSKGRMNKDLDERLVPNGEYRDALNVEVSTSEGSNVGAVQTLMGNTALTTHVDAGSTCVGAIADTQNDKIYWLVAGPSSGSTTTSGSSLHSIYRDYILEHETSTAITKYVAVDIHAVLATAVVAMSSSTSLQVYDSKGIRRGMTVSGAGAPIGTTVSSVDHSTNTVTLSANGTVILNSLISFEAPTNQPNNTSSPRGRALNFQSSRLVTGLNIIDGLLFWTDNHTEPKKINIERSIFGTGYDNASTQGTGNSADFQTRLVTTKINGIGFEFTVDTGTIPIYISEKYITVIKTPPLTAPVLNMSSTLAGRGNILGTTQNMRFWDNPSGGGNILISGATVDIVVNPAVDYQDGDILILINDLSQTDFTDYLVRLEVQTGGTPASNGLPNTYNCNVLTVDDGDDGAPDADQQWRVLLEQPSPMFERKFVRFAYRYKFEDGEYSSFSPFSNIAFLPGEFDYVPKKGHNLGMSNDLRTLKIQDFVLEKGIRPRDISEIDILYREDGSPNVYTVKTVTKDSDEWNADGSGNGITGGEILIESDTIHAAVSSNQILRPFDAVPRKALAQDMVGNRIVYGNYLQGYNLINSQNKNIDIALQTSLGVDNLVSYGYPEKSLKSMRDYQVGIVYRDVYGRQTPVLITENDATKKNTVKVPKKQSVTSNKLVTEILNQPPKWADSFKFFVKETSNEYYNLVMDRWYNAEDDNIWISFASSERNKGDEETFLILKKKHDGTTPVLESDTKYKVLAIENEAPDFIKINDRFLDSIGNQTISGTPNAVFGNTGGTSGYPLFQTDHVIVANTQWDESALSDEATSGDCYLRFRADNAGTSSWYQITAIKEGTDGTKLVIDGNFQSDISFTSTANSYATRINGLRMDVKRQSVENRPEFDGKFFVKIYKDLDIRNNIIGDIVSSDDGDLMVSQQMRIRYVQTAQLDGHSGTSTTLGPNNNVVLTYKGAQTGYNNGAMTADGWELAADTAGYIGNYAATFAPGANFPGTANAERGGFDLPFDKIDEKGEGRDYWQAFAELGLGVTPGSVDNNHFFIDEAYFHEWNDTPQNKWHNNEKGYGQGIRPNPSPNNNISVPQDLYDISFANIHKDGWENIFSSSEYTIAGAFIDELYQVGTRFRWKEDPDQVIYTVEETVYRQDYIKNYYNNSANDPENKRVKWTMSISPRVGQGASGYIPTVMSTHDEVNFSTYADGYGSPATTYDHGNIGSTTGTSTGTKAASLMQPHGNSPGHTIQILQPLSGINNPDPNPSVNPGIWETEPKEDVGLDIYYEIGNTYPVTLDHRTNEQFIPFGSTFVYNGTTYKVTNWNETTVSFKESDDTASNVAIPSGTELLFKYPTEHGVTVGLTDRPGAVTAIADGVGTSGTTSTVKLKSNIHNTSRFILPWYNCFAFGNGVESNRIRDDFNAMFIDKGVKVSTTIDDPYAEQRKGSSLIFGGIYNSRNGINNTNQFIEADGITKDLNPKYGSIQKLHTRDGDIVALCEDKIFKIIAYKDALFNADGNPQLIATNRVLGTATPVRGEYGISKNPESFAFQGYQAYFTDKARGVVLRMSLDGLTSISNVGMKDYFSDILKATTGNITGTYDDKKGEYNITLNNTTLAWNEGTKGWVSFRSYLPEASVSFNNTYYTFKSGNLYQHHHNATRNNFYGTQYDSDITVLINDSPGSIKNFKTLNYEGSQAKVTQFRTQVFDSTADSLDGTYGDGSYYNLNTKTGWKVESISTDMQEGLISEFIEKEGKWFNYIRGVETTLSNLDQSEFSVQGIGEASSVSRSDSGVERDFKLNVTENND